MAKNADVVVDVLVAERVLKGCKFEDWKGHTHFDSKLIAGLNHFGHDDIE